MGTTTSFLFLMGISLALLSCKKESQADGQSPEISDITISETSIDGLFATGDEITLKGYLTDDSGLKSLQIDVHPADDSHGKKKVDQWKEIITIKLSGEEHDLDETIQIPKDITAGAYHLAFRIIDLKGNKSNEAVREILIGNNNPILKLEVPSLLGNTFSVGDTIYFKGNIEDNRELGALMIKMSDPVYPGYPVLFEEEFIIGGTGLKTWDLENEGKIKVPIPLNTVRTDYTMTITVTDREGNAITRIGYVKITS